MNDMQRIKKLSSVVFLTEDQVIETKKKIHKLIYLLQEAGEDFDQDFTFYYYGVFSPSLANDLNIAEELGYITQSKDEDDWGYTITFNNDKKDEFSNEDTLSTHGKKILKQLEEEVPVFLEALSTIVYLSRNYYNGVELKEKFIELKPKLVDDHFDRALELAIDIFEIN